MFKLTVPFTLADGALVPIKIMSHEAKILYEGTGLLATGSKHCMVKPELNIPQELFKVVVSNGKKTIELPMLFFSEITITGYPIDVILGMSFMYQFDRFEFNGPKRTATLFREV